MRLWVYHCKQCRREWSTPERDGAPRCIYCHGGQTYLDAVYDTGDITKAEFSPDERAIRMRLRMELRARIAQLMETGPLMPIEHERALPGPGDITLEQANAIIKGVAVSLCNWLDSQCPEDGPFTPGG